MRPAQLAYIARHSIAKQCLQCGSAFSAFTRRSGGEPVYCGRVCSGASRRKVRGAVCVACNQPFFTNRGRSERSAKGLPTYCDAPECRATKQSRHNLVHGFETQTMRQTIADIVANRRMIAAIQEQLHHG